MNKDIYADKALELVESGMSLFITGKAGAGKTTLLKRIKERANNKHKHVVVLSPTGVAAKNAMGVTIHSFLHLPLSPYFPGYKNRDLYKLSTLESSIVRMLDMIIIDEISMVRCDLLDMVDNVLKHYRNSNEAFGGIQIVFFGDLYQLMPVEKAEDNEKLKKYYDSPYFFSSKVYKQKQYPLFELKNVHRQEEMDFVKMLNHVRTGQVTPTELKMLQSRYSPQTKEDDNTILLTTHNYRARRHNEQKLEELNGRGHEYKAYKEGFFPTEEWPTSYKLVLKVGARVMFVRNDPDKQYVNGTLGRVIELDEKEVKVRLDDGKSIWVTRQKWDKQHYVINNRTKEITTEVCGSFTQLPLRLAWAVTIHKSQGLTFDKVVIDAGRAFTHGQVYVALSRCRKFRGITLVSPINQKAIKIDPFVVKFMSEAKRLTVDGEETALPKPKEKMNASLSRTLWMAKDGLSIDEMVSESGERKEIIYAHLAKLIEYDDVDVHKYLSDAKYKSIVSSINKVGTDQKQIKAHCANDILYGEINLVLATLKGSRLTHKKEMVSQESTEDDDWHFVDNINLTNISDCFFSHKCYVGMAEDGYYLKLFGQYIKLGGYASKLLYGKGWISIRPENKTHYKLIHIYNNRVYPIGTFVDGKNKIVYITPQSERCEIEIED